MSGELVEDSVTEKNTATAEKISVVQQGMPLRRLQLVG